MTRTWYNHLPAPVDARKYPRPLSLERHLSSPEALPTGYRRTHDRQHAVGTVDSIGLAGSRGSEVYRMRTQSHLYDDYDVETGLDLERMVAMRDGRLLADCPLQGDPLRHARPAAVADLWRCAMTTLRVHLKPREMAALIDGETVTVTLNGGRQIDLTGATPDWDAPR